MTEWLRLLIALCVVEFLHDYYEVWGIRKKIDWLERLQNGQKHGKWPFNINTRLKWVILHLSMLLIFVTLAYWIFTLLELSNTALIIIGIVTLLVSYVCTTWYVDLYHHHVGKLIRKHEK